MRHRTPRPLHETELALWAHVTRGVKPLSGRRFVVPDTAVKDKGADKAARAPSPATTPPPAPPPQPVRQPPPLAPIERRMLTALRRGSQSIEGVIDLHGMRQDEAHGALITFIMNAQRRGAKLVLVVTGKGCAGSGSGTGLGNAGFGEETRGVLRRNVPHWLRMPELRRSVMGFEEAARHHGGEGALYVRLRRLRDDLPG